MNEQIDLYWCPLCHHKLNMVLDKKLLKCSSKVCHYMSNVPKEQISIFKLVDKFKSHIKRIKSNK